MPYGSSTWTQKNVIGTSTPQLQNTSIIEQPGGNVIIAANDFENNTYFFWSPAGQPGVWHQESVGTSNETGTSQYSSFVEPMALTGNDTGVAIGSVNSADTCDRAYDQADGATGWKTQTVGCTPYPVPEALALQPGTDNEVAASLEGGGKAYFYWQADGSSTWNAETIPGLTGISYYTNPSVAAD